MLRLDMSIEIHRVYRDGRAYLATGPSPQPFNGAGHQAVENTIPPALIMRSLPDFQSSDFMHAEVTYYKARYQGLVKIIERDYAGDPLEVIPYGEGILTNSDKTIETGIFIDKNRITGKASEVGSAHFAVQLFSLESEGRWQGGNLAVIIEILKQKDPEKYKKQIEELTQAQQLLWIPQGEIGKEGRAQEAQRIWKNLMDPENPKSQLMPYGSSLHAMGLQMVPYQKDDKYILFKIYNSGGGLNEYHYKAPDSMKNKYQTMLEVKVLKEKCTPEFIESLLDFTSFDPHESYQVIFKILEKEENSPRIIKKEVIEAALSIFQSPQKSDNCALEWIFAYLKYSMDEHDYNELRWEIFKASAELIRQTRDPILCEKFGGDSDMGMVINKKLCKAYFKYQGIPQPDLSTLEEADIPEELRDVLISPDEMYAILSRVPSSQARYSYWD